MSWARRLSQIGSLPKWNLTVLIPARPVRWNCMFRWIFHACSGLRENNRGQRGVALHDKATMASARMADLVSVSSVTELALKAFCFCFKSQFNFFTKLLPGWKQWRRWCFLTTAAWNTSDLGHMLCRWISSGNIPLLCNRASDLGFVICLGMCDPCRRRGRTKVL